MMRSFSIRRGGLAGLLLAEEPEPPAKPHGDEAHGKASIEGHAAENVGKFLVHIVPPSHWNQWKYGQIYRELYGRFSAAQRTAAVPRSMKKGRTERASFRYFNPRK